MAAPSPAVTDPHPNTSSILGEARSMLIKRKRLAIALPYALIRSVRLSVRAHNANTVTAPAHEPRYTTTP